MKPVRWMHALGSLIIFLDTNAQPNQQDGKRSNIDVQFHVVLNSEAQELD